MGWGDFDGLTRDECIGVLGDLIVQRSTARGIRSRATLM